MAFNDKKIGRINHMLIIFIVVVWIDLANGPNNLVWTNHCWVFSDDN